MNKSIHAPYHSTLTWLRIHHHHTKNNSYRLLLQSRLPSGAFKKPPCVGCAPLKPSHRMFHDKIFSFFPPSPSSTRPSFDGIAGNGAQPREASGGHLRLSTAARTSRCRTLWLCIPVAWGILLLSSACWQYMHDGRWRWSTRSSEVQSYAVHSIQKPGRAN